MQELTLPGAAGDPSTPAVAALPPGARRGMVVIHEIFGRQPEIDRVVLRFAEAGYATVAPDLFADGMLRCMRAVVGELAERKNSLPVRRTVAARDWLMRETGLPEKKIGIIGFCFGGMFALVVGHAFGAVSTNYGARVPATDVLRGMGPVIGCYGGRDLVTKRQPGILERRLARVGVTPELHVYPDAGHSFLTDGHHPIASAASWPIMHVGFHERSAQDAWPKIMDFFERSL
ncbi:MAG TPA: dienelactone hydrolase family protein [Polyangiaceae bacterium]|nr:dienelactone hydrolase family protein [Polyangiaceae bacterium]